MIGIFYWFVNHHLLHLFSENQFLSKCVDFLYYVYPFAYAVDWKILKMNWAKSQIARWSYSFNHSLLWIARRSYLGNLHLCNWVSQWKNFPQAWPQVRFSKRQTNISNAISCFIMIGITRNGKQMTWKSFRSKIDNFIFHKYVCTQCMYWYLK